MSILMIEDDVRIVQFVKRGLEAEGYLVEICQHGKEGLELALSGEFELILLDLMLPGIDGLEICRQLRLRGNTTPVLMLTAMDSLEQKVDGLNTGADDYLTKPFAFDELVARVQALIRRRQGFVKKSQELIVGDLVVNLESHEVRRNGQAIELTAKEFVLLTYLMSSPGKVLSRTRILDKVWGVSADPLTNVVEVYIRNLRRKIDENHAVPLIKTVRGFGYKLDDAQ